MIGWNDANGKIEGQNKILDLTNHIEGVAKSQLGKRSPFIKQPEQFPTSPYRATTSPSGQGFTLKSTFMDKRIN